MVYVPKYSACDILPFELKGCNKDAAVVKQPRLSARPEEPPCVDRGGSSSWGRADMTTDPFHMSFELMVFEGTATFVQ